MFIELNGEEFSLETEISVANFIKEELDVDDVSSLVVVLNDEVIKKENYGLTKIKEGDIVELVRFVEGG